MGVQGISKAFNQIYKMPQRKKIQPLHTNKSKHIAVSNDNYSQLKELGKFGDTFNDIVTELLERATKSNSRVPSQNQTPVVTKTPPNERDFSNG